MNKVEARRLADGLIWMPEDVGQISESTFDEFPFRGELYSDVASNMEDLAILQRRRQREFLIDESSDIVERLKTEIEATMVAIHTLFISDFDAEADRRIILTPYQNYDMTGRYDIAALSKRFRNSDENHFALTLGYLASWSSERDQYLTHNDETLGDGERLAGLKNTATNIQIFRKQLAFICGKDEFQQCLM